MRNPRRNCTRPPAHVPSRTATLEGMARHFASAVACSRRRRRRVHVRPRSRSWCASGTGCATSSSPTAAAPAAGQVSRGRSEVRLREQRAATRPRRGLRDVPRGGRRRARGGLDTRHQVCQGSGGSSPGGGRARPLAPVVGNGYINHWDHKQARFLASRSDARRPDLAVNQAPGRARAPGSQSAARVNGRHLRQHHGRDGHTKLKALTPPAGRRAGGFGTGSRSGRRACAGSKSGLPLRRGVQDLPLR